MQKEKTVVITGGASGIGLAITQMFAERGHHTIFLDYNSNAGTEVASTLSKKGQNVQFIQTDVSDFNSVKTTFEQIPDTIDVLVNNAGVSHVGNLEETSEEDFERLFQVNVKGIYTCSNAAIGKLK
jgi:2-keto-3-deoxy-L-fuconate dehydrogenase